MNKTKGHSRVFKELHKIREQISKEMAEIKSNKKLLKKLESGHRDAKSKKGK